MKKILTFLLVILSLNSYGKLMNKLGTTSQHIWDSIPDPICKNDGFYNGVTIMLVIGSNATGLNQFPNNGPYWTKPLKNFNQPHLYYLDDFKRMVKRGANLYFFVSPEVSKSTILETLPLSDMIVYIGHGGFQNRIPEIFNMEIPVKQYLKENPNIKSCTSSNGHIPYGITSNDLKNIKLKTNSLVLMFTVCYSSGESAGDPMGGISIEEARIRTESYSKMFLDRGAKCYFAYNTLKTMFPLFESGISIKDVRSKLIMMGEFIPMSETYNKYFKDNHVIFYNRGEVTLPNNKKIIANDYGYCLVGDFNYNINTLRGK